MADGPTRYLTPRSYDEDEINFVRETADLWERLLRKDPLTELKLRLVPACFMCASDELYETHSDLAFVCRECGARSSSSPVRAGRLAFR